MCRSFPILIIFAIITGCANEAKNSEYSACQIQALEKFPVQSIPQNYTEIEYFQKQEGMTCTRIPSGFYNAGGMECEPNMRTYQRQVQKTRYVDANAGGRNNWREQCVNQQCIRKFGNSDCEIEDKNIYKPTENWKTLLTGSMKKHYSSLPKEELMKINNNIICAASREEPSYKPSLKILEEIKRRNLVCEKLNPK